MNSLLTNESKLIPEPALTRIIIVEDSIDVSDSIRDVIELEIEACSIIQASNFAQAKLLIEQEKPDIALLDIKLAQFNGLDLIPLLKDTNPDVACIVLTAYRDVKYTVKAIRFGANDYLHKPVEPLKLIQVIQQMIERLNLRKRLLASQQQVQVLNESLEKKVKDKTALLQHTIESLESKGRDLEKAKLEAEEANRVKSEFLSSMSHELRTPLNAILGFSQLLQQTPEIKANKHNLENIDEIYTAGRHLLNLVNDILDLARIESGKMTLTLCDVKFNELLTDCLSLVDTQIEQNGITVVNNVNAISIVNADHTRLKQVLLNILSNAIKYNRQQGNIIISTEVVDNSLKVSITDSGDGLSQQQIAKLFVSFERLNNPEQVEGAGIGLVICKHLIEAMGGTIGVTSKLDVGSTFWFKISLSNISQEKIH